MEPTLHHGQAIWVRMLKEAPSKERTLALRGRVVNGLAQAEGSPWTLRIGHPSGVLAVALHRRGDAVTACEVQRSARMLMRGAARYVVPPVPAVSLGEAAA